MSDLEPGHEDALLAALARVLDQVEPLAPFVTEAASIAYSWRRVDAELAELLGDSAQAGEALAGAHRSTTGVRAITFKGSTVTIELELRGDRDRLTLLGQLAPPAATQVELERVGEERATSTVSDELGLFRFELSSGPAIRLRVLEVGARSRWVQTSWIGL